MTTVTHATHAAYARHRPPRTSIEFDPCATTLKLDRRQHVQVRSLCGWSVCAVDGSLWITQEGESRDIILAPGEIFRVERDAPLLIGALGKAEASILRTHTGCTASRMPSLQRLLAAWMRLARTFISVSLHRRMPC